MMFFNQTRAQGSNGAANWLFLIGLFSQTQISIGGKIGISELLMVLCAPLIFIRDISLFRKDGNLYFLVMIILWLFGAIFADWYFDTYFPFSMRGIAVPITVFSCVVCLYVLLRKNPDNLKWLLLGYAISGVISIFVFQRGMAGDIAAEQGASAAVETVVGYKLFYFNQLMAWLTLPIAGWYLAVRKWYSVPALAFLTAFALFIGGRSAFLITACSLVIIAFAGKTVASALFLRRHMITVFCVLGILAALASFTYKYAAKNGMLGEYEQKKYEMQTKTGTDVWHLLMSGRSEFFVAFFAAIDSPIIGRGSLALDEKGYFVKFLSEYGDDSDYQRALKADRINGMFFIPFHSHIMTYWMWHGVFALIFWTTTIILAVRTLFSRMHIFMPWYGYFAVTIPYFFWDVLFSPFGGRVKYSLLWVTFLLVSKFEHDQKRGIVHNYEVR